MTGLVKGQSVSGFVDKHRLPQHYVLIIQYMQPPCSYYYYCRYYYSQ